MDTPRQLAVQQTPTRRTGEATVGLSDLHSGLTPDLCSLVLRDFHQDPLVQSEGAMTPSHYGVVPRRLEDLFSSSKQQDNDENDGDHAHIGKQFGQDYGEQQHFDRNLDAL